MVTWPLAEAVERPQRSTVFAKVSPGSLLWFPAWAGSGVEGSGYLRTASNLLPDNLSVSASSSLTSVTHTNLRMHRNRVLDCVSEALRKEEFASSFISAIMSSFLGKGTEEVSGPVLLAQMGHLHMSTL